jgi:hypothetical protein
VRIFRFPERLDAEEDGNDHGHTDRNDDIEADPPGRIMCYGPADEGTKSERGAFHTATDSKVDRAMFERGGVRDNTGRKCYHHMLCLSFAAISMAYMLMPANMPPAPRPLIARPTINAEDVGAAADRTEPMTKLRKDNIYIVFIE